jgi:hypothetical protein
MAKIISETVTESVSSIPDTEASGTTVAGCSYAVKKVEGQKIQSILVVSRRLPDDDAAIQTFDRLTKKDATKIDNIADEAFLLSGKKQAIVRKGAAIVTINIIPVSEIENQADIVGSIISKL